MRKRAASGALVGLALGDALGSLTEFRSVAQIELSGPWRHMPLPIREDGVAYITDDTQMTLAVAEGLREAHPPVNPGATDAQRVEWAVRRRFVEWLHAPDNTRAPGNTCLRACRALESGGPWQRATVHDSKGCGANMRVAPVALVPDLPPEWRSGAAQLQAALTHGHPTGLAASDLTAHAVWLLAQGSEPWEVLPALRSYALASRAVYREEWLGDLAVRAQPTVTPAQYIAAGWDECLSALDQLAAALRQPDPEQDPCLATGAGWVAEEALMTGLLCFLLFPDDPVTAVRRAACTSGDSDSIACLTGAFAGARHGLAAWPQEWVAVIEHRDRLLALGMAWDGSGT